MKKFEYTSDWDLSDTAMTSLGADGWELVSVILFPGTFSEHSFKMFFKREIK